MDCGSRMASIAPSLYKYSTWEVGCSSLEVGRSGEATGRWGWRRKAAATAPRRGRKQSASAGFIARERHAGGAGAGHEIAFFVRDVAFDQPEFAALFHDAGRGTQVGSPHRAQVVDLQLDGGKRLAYFQLRGVGHA